MPPVDLIVGLLRDLVLPAALTSLVLVGLAMLLVHRKWWDLAVALALALGMIAGNYLRGSLPYLPEYYGWPWLLPSSVILSLVAGIAFTCYSNRPLIKTLLITVAVTVLTWFIVPVELHHATKLLTFAAICLANGFILEKVADRISPLRLYLLTPFVLFKGATLVVVCAHSGRMADAAALPAAVLLGIAALNFWKPISFKVTGQMIAFYLPALMLSGQQNTYSEVPMLSFILIAIAPLFFAPLLIPAVAKLSPRVQLGLQILLPLIPIALAVALAIHAEGFAVPN